MKNIGKVLTAIGILGIIGCAESLETSLATFIVSEAVAFGIAIIGVRIENKRAAEAEAPAANIESGVTRNS